jgi:hypothetical protein
MTASSPWSGGGGGPANLVVLAMKCGAKATERRRWTSRAYFSNRRSRALIGRARWRRQLHDGELARARLGLWLRRRWWRGRRDTGASSARSDAEEAAWEWRSAAAEALRCGKAQRELRLRSAAKLGGCRCSRTEGRRGELGGGHDFDPEWRRAFRPGIRLSSTGAWRCAQHGGRVEEEVWHLGPTSAREQEW